MPSQSLKPSRLLLALVTAGIVGGASVTAFEHIPAAHAENAPTAVTTTGVPIALPDFAAIAKREGAAVVNITVVGEAKASNTGMDMQGDDPFGEFFRRFQGPNGEQFGGRSGGNRMRPHPRTTRGEGSGFIVSADGIVMTNAHVVKDAKEVTVKLTDRRELRAKVLGADPKTDIAVLKIDATNLPVVAIGDSKSLQPGQWVMAMGSPFGFENTVTAGVVSATGRSLPDDSAVPFIQTDVPVNPGNSGGPLFNTQGQVVGVNSQIYSRTGGYQGVSFSIPIDLATKIKDQIVKTGKVEHARLGVVVQEVNQQLADSFKLPSPEGALVASVEKGGPADKAGLATGDVIRKVDGKPIVSSGDLPAAIALSTPGEKLQLEVWRKGSNEQLSATLGSWKDKSAQLASNGDTSGKDKLGLALRPLQPDEKSESGVESGLLIEDARGPAAMAGIQQGDVLLAVNGTPVTSIAQVRSVLGKSDKSVALLVQRGEEKIFVPVRIG